jgi:hypothetical protein
LKGNIKKKLELLYIKDIKIVQQKSNFIEWEHMSYQQPPYPQFEKSSSIYIPPRKRIFPLDTKKDRSLCFKCNATNWCLGHKFKDKKFYLCKKINGDNDNEEEVGDTSIRKEKLTTMNLEIGCPFQHSILPQRWCPFQHSVLPQRWKGHVALWWDELQADIRCKDKSKIKSWDRMVAKLKSNFIPKDYQVNLFRKL